MNNRANLTKAEAGTFPIHAAETSSSILICILGEFCVLKERTIILQRTGSKAEALLCHLAVQRDYCLPRDALLSVLWPDSDAALSGQSLNSLTYTVRKLLGKHLGGASPVIHSDGDYRLNIEAGIAVDIARFDAWAEAGDQQLRAGNRTEAADLYENAVGLYRGDLSVGSDVHSVLERERLRARYQSLLAQLADFSFAANDYVSCLRYSRQLLEHDPCREGAHRLMMRCYSRCGERAQALRQYRLCVEALHNEFDAQPEAATIALFDQIRFDRGNT